MLIFGYIVLNKIYLIFQRLQKKKKKKKKHYKKFFFPKLFFLTLYPSPLPLKKDFFAASPMHIEYVQMNRISFQWDYFVAFPMRIIIIYKVMYTYMVYKTRFKDLA